MDEKVTEAFELLVAALKEFESKPKDRLKFLAASKAFEVCFEYVWKFFKREADKAGIETYSPRDAIKAAAQQNFIEDLKLWNEFLNARNLSVHDYIKIDDKTFLPLSKRFIQELKKVKIN